MTHALRALALLMLATAGPAQAVWLTVEPPTRSVAAGDVFSVEVRASQLPDDEIITFFNLLLGYDASLLFPGSVTFSEALGDPDDPNATFNASVLDFDPVDDAPPGYGGYRGLHNTAVQFENLAFTTDPEADLGTRQASQPFALVNIEFSVRVGTGWTETSLQLMDDSFYEQTAAGGNFDIKGKDFGNILSATTADGRLINAAPVPATWLLVAPAVLLLRSRRRRPGDEVRDPRCAPGGRQGEQRCGGAPSFAARPPGLLARVDRDHVVGPGGRDLAPATPGRPYHQVSG